MQLVHLEVFVNVARELSFAGAARALTVAPSRITERIRELEAELRAELFQRSAHRVELTQAGHALLPRAEAVMREITLISTLFPKEHFDGLSVGLRSLPADFLEEFADLVRNAGNVAVTFLPLDPKTQTQMLQRGRLDFGVLWSPPPAPLRGMPLITEITAIAVPATERFADLAVVKPEDLAGLRLGSLQADLVNMPVDFAGYLDYLPNIDRVNPSVANALYILVAGGRHCAFVPLASAAHASLSAETSRNILIKPLMEPAPRMTSYLVWTPEVEALPAGRAVIDAARRRFPAPDVR